ncbi:MAG: pterin-4-alpha-carbinolamine dehydratase [Gammaproteobacteria bacterium]|nr:pterin-4-alpha-carbinolamine dehydratase [Gammaproteobacteria bacterium]
MSSEWRERKRPARLENRYEFSSYDDLRDFLDRAAELSESVGLYPDMGFGRDYVNITIHADEGSDEISAEQHTFAEQLDKLNNGESLT